MSKHTYVECPTCRASGFVPLKEHLEETLSHFTTKARPSLTAEQTHARLAKSVGLQTTVPAINARLEELRASRLLTRARHGKSWVYTATELAADREEQRTRAKAIRQHEPA